jgi:NRPS condensation-like uncharacterized protein
VVEQTQEWKRSGAAAQAAVGVGLADRIARKKGLDVLRKQTEAAAAKLGHGTGYPALSDMGVIADAQVDFGLDAHVKSAYLFGPIAFPSGFMLTASTFRDCLRVSAGLDREATDIKLARSIVDGTAEELEKAVA